MTKGYLYVATGPKYREEAWRYSEGLRTHTSYPICLITDAIPEQPRWWDDLILIENPCHSYMDKLFMQRSPYERTLFMDTDTWVHGNIDALFDILDQYDLAAHQLGEGHQYKITEVSDAFPEFNTGVILFSRGLVGKGFFNDWQKTHQEWQTVGKERGLAAFDMKSDQLSFRLTVYRSREVRTHVLPPEYNFMGVFPSYAVTKVYVVHHRPLEAIPALLAADNPGLHHRIYLPSRNCFVGERMGRHDLRYLLPSLVKSWLKETLRHLAGEKIISAFKRLFKR